MKIKDKTGVEVKGTALSSNIMGKKAREKKIRMDSNTVENLDFNQVNYSAKQLEDFFAKHNKVPGNGNSMKMDEYDSDDSDITVIGNNQHSENPSVNNSKNKMADNANSSTVNDNKNTFNTELYKHTDKGPYYVICEFNEIDEFKLCEKFLKFKLQDIVSVTKISKHKVRIHTKSYNSANKIIKMGQFDDFRKYKIYIPDNFVFTDGTVRDIPLYYEPDQLMEIINCKVPIVKIERLNKWNKFTQTSHPSTTLKISFRSATVPDNISFMWLLRKVEIFVQKPLFCVFCA